MSQTLLKTVANFESSLVSKLAAGDTSLVLVSNLDKDGNALTDGIYGFTASEGEPNEEHMAGVVSGSNVTSLVRNIQRNDGKTAQTGKAHRKGASIKITNFPAIQRVINILDGTTDLDSGTPLKYDGDPTLTDDGHISTIKYVNDIAIAGAPDASTTVKGIVEEATTAEVVAGTQTGGTSARLFINPGSIVDKILTALERTWVRAIEGATTPTEVNQLAGTTNIAEADTFFDNTDISGAEAETLSDGSNADSLHAHNFNGKVSIITSDVTVANTTDETNLIQVSIPGGTLGTNNGIKVRLYINNQNTTAQPTLTIRAKYGTTTIVSNSRQILNTGGRSGFIDILLLATGAPTTQEASMVTDLAASGDGTSVNVLKMSGNGTAGEDSPSALNLTITAQWSVASASNTISMAHAITESIK